MADSFPAQEGFIPFRGFRVWYQVIGSDSAGKLPLLILHGGPGVPHDYLEPLEILAQSGRRVIFYDQLGCGNSDHPHDPSLWSVSLFREELAVVREALGLTHLHLLGNSWGGMLAMEHALSYPTGLASLVLHSAPASMRQWSAEANRLRMELPAEVQQILTRHEQAGTTNDPAYEEAMLAFYRRHVCRIDPWPECLQRAFAKLAEDPEVYHTMVGPSEFHVTGVIKDWDIVDCLPKIQVPTLVLSGRYDEATPAVEELVYRGIPNSTWVRFEHSSHLAHLEEPHHYRQVVETFLSQVEAVRAGKVPGKWP